MRIHVGVVALALWGCKDEAPARRPPPERAAAVDAAPDPTLRLTAAGADGTRDVEAVALVVVRADGALAVMAAGAHPASLDVTALAAGTPVTLDVLATKTDEVLAAARGQRAPLTREQALEAARAGTPLITTPCGIFTDVARAPIEDGDEISGGFGYSGPGFGGGGTGPGWDSIRNPYSQRTPAGLRGVAVRDDAPSCTEDAPLVLVDARANARRLVAVLEALPRATLAVTTDGGAHARALPLLFTYRAGNTPGADTLELGFVIAPDTITGDATAGAQTFPAVWHWTGSASELPDAYHQGQSKGDLVGKTVVRLRLDGDVIAGRLVDAIAHLLAGNVDGVAIGEPVDFLEQIVGEVGGGRGRMHAPGEKVPKLTIGEAKVTGDLDAATVRRYVRRNIGKLRYCYEKGLLVDAKLAGTVRAHFLIKPDGIVDSSTAEGVHADVSSCIAAVLQGIEFPKPKNGGAGSVTFPFTFAPTGG